VPPLIINHARGLKISKLALRGYFLVFSEVHPYRKRYKLPAVFSFAWEEKFFIDGF